METPDYIKFENKEDLGQNDVNVLKVDEDLLSRHTDISEKLRNYINKMNEEIKDFDVGWWWWGDTWSVNISEKQKEEAVVKLEEFVDKFNKELQNVIKENTRNDRLNETEALNSLNNLWIYISAIDLVPSLKADKEEADNANGKNMAAIDASKIVWKTTANAVNWTTTKQREAALNL